MPETALNLRAIKATATVDGTGYTAHLTGFKFTPAPKVAEVVDISGVTHSVAGESAWQFIATVTQDFSATGFARKCLDNEGDAVELVVVDGPSTYTSTISLVAPEIGGAGNTIGQSQITFPSTKPVLTASA